MRCVAEVRFHDLSLLSAAVNPVIPIDYSRIIISCKLLRSRVLLTNQKKAIVQKSSAWEPGCMVLQRHGTLGYPQKEIFVSRETFVFQLSDDSGVNQLYMPGNILECRLVK